MPGKEFPQAVKCFQAMEEKVIRQVDLCQNTVDSGYGFRKIGNTKIGNTKIGNIEIGNIKLGNIKLENIKIENIKVRNIRR